MALSTSAVVTLFRFRHPPSALLKSLAYRHFATTSSSDDNNWASTSSSSQWSDRSAARSGGDLTIRYERGLPIVSVPLPSRKEICQFTVRPVSDTVGDLCRNISAEDRGIDLVAMYSSDGVRISYSTRVEHVLQLGAFQLRINDTMYTAAPPTPLPLVDAESAAAVDAAHVSTEHLQTIADVKSTIGALYAALHVDEHKLKIERDLLVKLEQLRTQVRPLEEMKALIDAECERRTDRLLWLGMAAMGAQMGVYARLTWWEYSWDIMEPVTYFTTYATVIGSFGYYLLTRQ
uniref:Calcium uniporter protein n=1 Tax=Plectus sambesii TaxID=2011161 RepID=A0A914W6Q5_9BILA